MRVENEKTSIFISAKFLRTLTNDIFESSLFNMTSNDSQIQFGVMAVEKEFITAGQLGKAVNVQMKEDLSGMKHRLLGEILVDMGFITENQINEVLKAVKKT